MTVSLTRLNNDPKPPRGEWKNALAEVPQVYIRRMIGGLALSGALVVGAAIVVPKAVETAADGVAAVAEQVGHAFSSDSDPQENSRFGGEPPELPDPAVADANAQHIADGYVAP